MELQDLKNTKHIKVFATTSVATIAVATSTAPVLAHGNNSQTGDYGRSYTTKQINDETKNTDDSDKDCEPGATQTPATKPTSPTTTSPTSQPAPPTPPKATETPKTVATTTPTTTITPAATIAAPTEQKAAELPKTGPTQVAAIGGLAAVGGYFANLFRLKRRGQ